jgi:hypothetical protein
MEYRMGSQSEPNRGLLMGAIVYLLSLVTMDAEEAEESGFHADANKLWKVGAYVCILTAASLRGHEGFFVDLTGLRDNLSAGRFGVIPAGFVIDKGTLFTEEICNDLPHVTVAMLGHFKGGTGVDQHLISLANESVSGLKTRWWIEKLVSVCEAEGRVHGPAFASAYGVLASSADYNAVFRKYLGQVQDKTDFIPGETDVDAQYSTFRTPRKLLTTRLERAGFGDELLTG